MNCIQDQTIFDSRIYNVLKKPNRLVLGIQYIFKYRVQELLIGSLATNSFLQNVEGEDNSKSNKFVSFMFMIDT